MKNVVKYWDAAANKFVTVTPDNPLPIKLQFGDLLDVHEIENPSEATTEEVALAFNQLLSALKGG